MERKLILLLFIFVTLTGSAQNSGDIGLCTDRDIYTSGDQLLFKVFVPADEQSLFDHLDLINCNGKRICGVTTEIIEHQSDGFIDLPDSMSSGSYLIRASTRTAKTLTFKEIYVTNRFSDLPGSNTDLRPSKVVPFIETQTQTLRIDGIEKIYKTRMNGRGILHLSDELLAQTDGDLLVCITDNFPEYSPRTFALDAQPLVMHIPEKEGIILEGLVTDLKINDPFESAVVFLSVSDSFPGFKYYITGADGRFFFQLEKSRGKIFTIIQGFDNKQNRPLRITLDDPEGTRGELPPFETWIFPVDLLKRIEKNTDMINLRKVFDQQKLMILPALPTKADPHPSFGVPTKIVYPKLFFDLPDFNEISRELLTGVKFRTYNRIPTLQLYNPLMHNFFNDTPLLLLNGIPIRDFNIIKDMGTKEIDKVEIYQKERFYGDLTFPGIISIRNSKFDYTFISDSEDYIKLNLDVIQIRCTLNTPMEQLLNEPDLRQVLLWKPAVEPRQIITFDFQTSDIRGSYKLVIRGKTKDKSIFYKEQIFEVN